MEMPKFPNHVQKRKEIAKKLFVIIKDMGGRANDVIDGGTIQYWMKKAIHEICPEILWAPYDWLDSDDLDIKMGP